MLSLIVGQTAAARGTYGKAGVHGRLAAPAPDDHRPGQRHRAPAIEPGGTAGTGGERGEEDPHDPGSRLPSGSRGPAPRVGAPRVVDEGLSRAVRVAFGWARFLTRPDFSKMTDLRAHRWLPTPGADFL